MMQVNPRPIKPMLAVLGRPFSSRDWIYEPKIDGTRCIAHIRKGSVILQNRRLVDITYRYPEIARALSDQSDCVLDGEIAVFSKGLPDFSALEMREHQLQKRRIDYLSKAESASYIVFDIISSDGRSMIGDPLSDRKRALLERLKEKDCVSIIDFFSENGEAYYKAAVKMGLEGIMAKRMVSIYQPGVHSSDWIKIKKSLTADLAVGGYIPGIGNREPFFGGLLLGAYDKDELVYIGRVGSGFSVSELDFITRSFNLVSESPFSEPPSTPGAVWIKPEMVVEVTAMEVTHDGHLRAPVFLRIRDDKMPKECSLEQIKFGRPV
jgi:DNA ligase D-like protein (predicted ligase)